jgi:hypothetical protein
MRDAIVSYISIVSFVFSERAEIPGMGGFDGESSMASNESSYTLEMMGSRHLKKGGGAGDLPYQDPMNWKAKVNAGANFVSRTGQDAQLDRLTGVTKNSNSRAAAAQSFKVGNGFSEGRVDPEKQLRAELVIMRTRQENCRDFIAHCGNSAAAGPWSKRTGRNVEELLTDCVDIIETNYNGAQAETDGEYNDLAAKIEALAAELALCPDTYYAISELFSAANTRREEAERAAYEGAAARERGFQEGEGDDDYTDVAEGEEDMSTYDKDGLFAHLDDGAGGGSRSSRHSSHMSLSPDIAEYLSGAVR